jgi:hypothetical protein
MKVNFRIFLGDSDSFFYAKLKNMHKYYIHRPKKVASQNNCFSRSYGLLTNVGYWGNTFCGGTGSGGLTFRIDM